MSAQRVKLSTEMQFIQDALKSGRATLQKYSMKPLRKLDPAMQPRVIHLNMDHVKNLGDILQVQLKLERDLDPGVLFRDPTAGWLGLVDGWHRLKAYQVAKMDYFPAYVIEGTREEAIEYAAMANQHAMLRRTPEDIEKQLNMLFAVPKWWGSSIRAIAAHVGVNIVTVQKYKVKFGRTTGLPLGDESICINGRKVKRKARLNAVFEGTQLPAISWHPRRGYSAKFLRKTLSLGNVSKEDAERRLRLEIEAARGTIDCRRSCLATGTFGRFLTNVGLYFRKIMAGDTRHGVVGFSGHGCTITTAELAKLDRSAIRSFGPILALREFDNPAHRAVVVCYPEDGPEEILDLGRRLGVEFLTPEQLVASLQGDGDGDTQGAPATDDRDTSDDGLDSVKVQTVDQFLAEFHAKGDDDSRGAAVPPGPDELDAGQGAAS